jgi:hypothetical protein
MSRPEGMSAASDGVSRAGFKSKERLKVLSVRLALLKEQARFEHSLLKLR